MASDLAFSTARGLLGPLHQWSVRSVVSPQTSPTQRNLPSSKPCSFAYVVYAGPMSRRRVRRERPPAFQKTEGAAKGRFAPSKGHRGDNGLSTSERLQKVMSRFGVASRRESEKLIEQGRVCVNGKQVRDQGRLVNWREDVVTLDGRQIESKVNIMWVAVHKPRGYLSIPNATSRRSIEDLLPRAAQQKLVPVENLEADYNGLVVLTNERGGIQKLQAQSSNHVREWIVDCEGNVGKQSLIPLQKGVTLEGESLKVGPASITVVGAGKVELNRNEIKMLTRVEVRIRENGARLIRRMFESVGITVVRASLRSLGPVRLGSLKRGEFRYLTSNEVKALKRGVRNR